MKIRNYILLGLALMAMLFTAPAKAALNDWAPLSINSQAAFGWNYQGVFDATNFTALVTNANNGAANTIFPRPGVGTVNFPANTRVRNVSVKVTTPFATSGGATAVALSIGDSTTTNRFLSGVAIGTNVTSGTWYVNPGTNYLYTTATNLSLYLQVTGGNAATLNAGRIEVFLDADPLGNVGL